jgi:hypothetical protein
MTTSRLVAMTLLRFYRPILLWFVGTVALGDLIGMAIITRVTDPEFSLWVMVFGTGVKYWLLIVGVMVVSLHLRQFITNGITRRDFTIGAGVAGAILAVVLAALVPIGHAVEAAVLHIGGAPAGYLDPAASLALHEFGYALVSGLAFLVSGLAVAAGFYRYGGWPGILVLVPALVPMGIAESLLGLGEKGDLDTRFVPFAVAALVTLGATAVIAVCYRLLTRDVAIRRTTG